MGSEKTKKKMFTPLFVFLLIIITFPFVFNGFGYGIGIFRWRFVWWSFTLFMIVLALHLLAIRQVYVAIRDPEIPKGTNVLYHVFIYSVFILAPFAEYALISHSLSTESKLELQAYKIRRTIKQMAKKERETRSIRSQYLSEIDAFRNEINTLRDALEIEYYDDASRNTRIMDNLHLIQQRFAYLRALRTLQSDIALGIEDLRTAERKLKGVIPYHRLLDASEAEAAMDSAARTIESATRFETRELTIDTAHLIPVKEIWYDIVDGILGWQEYAGRDPRAE